MGVVPCAPGGPWVTARPHYRGSALSGWGVQVKGGRKPAWMASSLAPVPEERSQGRRSRRGGTLKGVAVCLCFSAIRETCRGPVMVRLSAFRLPPLCRREKAEPPTHADRFAGSYDACPEEGACHESKTRTAIPAHRRRALSPLTRAKARSPGGGSHRGLAYLREHAVPPQEALHQPGS